MINKLWYVEGMPFDPAEVTKKVDELIDHIDELEKKVEVLSQGKSELKEQLDCYFKDVNIKRSRREARVIQFAKCIRCGWTKTIEDGKSWRCGMCLGDMIVLHSHGVDHTTVMEAPVIETCDQNHKYYKEGSAKSRCPYCLSTGLDDCRRELILLREQHRQPK